jgi:hypothetical protein
MHAADHLALFGVTDADRARLAEDAKLAQRFAEQAKELAKHWRAEQERRVRGTA